MRRNPALFISLLVLLVASAGCVELLDRQIRIPLTFSTESEFVLPPTQETGYNELSVDVIPSDFLDFLSENEVDLSNIENATIGEVSLEILTPGITFNILSDVKVEVELDGQRITLGSLDVAGEEVTEVTIPISGQADVIALLDQSSFKVFLSGTLEEPIETEVLIKARIDYDLKVLI